MSRKIAFRYDLLRGGAYYARLLADESTPPRIRGQRDERIKTAFSGQFKPYGEDVDGNPMEINFLTDEVQPVLIIDGVESPLGVFIPTTPDGGRDGPHKYVSITGYDRCQRVADTKSASRVFFPSGTLVLDAVEQLLTASGIETVFKTPSSAAFSSAREEWDIGTPNLDIVNQLLEEISYRSLRFDAAGNAILEPKTEPDEAAVKHRLDTSDPETRLIDRISRVSDTFQAPNVFVATCANPDKGTLLRAVAYNDNPQSPLSRPRRGREIVRVTRLNDIESQAALQTFVDRQRDESLISGEIIRVSTGLQPGWSAGDVVSLRFDDLFALCVSSAFDMELKVGGLMSHTMERVVYNLE